MLLTIMQNVRFLGRQGLALRGHNDDESNFTQLLKLSSVDQTDICDWISKKGGDKYTSPKIQNEILTLMSQEILCVIARQLQQPEFFTTMNDECVDGANKEQFVICFRYVDENVDVHEEFVGLYECSNILANTIVTRLQDVMLRLNLQVSHCLGQCYDGGNNMAGCKCEVKAKILEQEPQALFTYCYGHSLSRSVVDTIRTVKYLGSIMNTVYEHSKLLQYSPKHLALFKDIKAEISPDSVGFRVHSPTQWTVRSETF